jgi:hypothetical protein
LPTTALSPANLFIQYSWVSTITGAAPVPSSPSLKGRPRMVESPMMVK